MARFRLSAPAQSDLATILATSRERWGVDGSARYARMIAAAMRTIAADPEGPLTRDRRQLLPGLRSLHVKHARGKHGVKAPVHVLFYRATDPALIEIVRVLHERMEPGPHLDEPLAKQGRNRRRPR